MAAAASRDIYAKASRCVSECVTSVWACLKALFYRGGHMANQAALQGQSVKRDSRGHLRIKTKLVSNSAVFCYALKVTLVVCIAWYFRGRTRDLKISSIDQ